MDLHAAGAYRRTRAQRASPWLSWSRPDRAFFASGACHILAWTCRELHPSEPIGIAALRATGAEQVFHAFATWGAWAFDHSGWHPADALVGVNQDFAGHAIERVEITTDLATFCRQHRHRMPHQYHDDPRPRARDYVRRFEPPWPAATAGEHDR
ncbi:MULTISPECIES: hypothetical protein [unclassified Nocardioides]|uniref:hypothetical protein n=1 Tax=unclassified Nocardioides TaxID=2615069 RepID=UPI00249CBA55|nr:hypothetical protein [Nocardioides sp. LHD-245]WGX94298.1 hypothetical protein QJ852_14165 [Nocardioides sp. L-11A]